MYKKFTKIIFMLVLANMTFAGCELLDMEEEEEEETSTDNSTYTYKYTCPTGRTNSIQIPNRLSSSCKRAWEYYARTVGCNDMDNYEDAARGYNACK
ncbi:hypothetical protein [Solitalea lacus]|uniref:hypothetical protein n=1 Tax=Solitalea lacus TaxID=2911172 RepID=UPI001EDA1C18|nr:hypothetical protein [Solitalea lacus]UKJ08763.1 hypothetical protein L2B55_06255 [Solitalea lacus]